MANNPNVVFAPLGVRSAADFPFSIIKLAQLIRIEKPTAIMCWMYHAMAAGCMAKILSRSSAPLIWNVRQSLDDPQSQSWSTRLAAKLCRALSGRASGIIYNSARSLDLHGQYGYVNRNAVFIPNGFDLPQLESISGREPHVFGIAGRFHPQKDHANFFEAAARLVQSHPEANFKVAGDGLTPDNAEVAKMIEAAGLPAESVELCGELSDMAPFYSSIDVLVLSSRTEGFPNVVAEAMSYGKPAITTDVGDAALIVKDTGWVVPARDPVALAAMMEQVLTLSPAAYAEMAIRARQRVADEYDLSTVAQKYQEFMELRAA